MENVTVTTSKVNLRGSSITCAAGVIEFNEEGVAEISLEKADLLRNVKHLSFSDQPEEVAAEDAVIEEEKELPVEQQVLETQSMPMNFGMPEGLETEATEEEVKEEEVPTEKEDDTEETENPLVAQLNELNVSDLKDLCEAGEAEGYKSMKKSELIDFIIKNDLIK